MNKATQLRYNIESLCIYQLKADPVMHSLLHLLRSVEAGEAVLEAQSAFFSRVAGFRAQGIVFIYEIFCAFFSITRGRTG